MLFLTFPRFPAPNFRSFSTSTSLSVYNIFAQIMLLINKINEVISNTKHNMLLTDILIYGKERFDF